MLAKAAADGRCYSPEFTVASDFGAFTASSTGSMSSGDASISWTLTEAVTGNNAGSPWGSTGGTMDGSLSADITVPGVGHTFHFTTHCIEEAAAVALLRKSPAGAGGGASYVKGVFEGALDLPPWSPGDNQAVLSLILTTFCAGACGSPSPATPVTHAYVRLAHGTQYLYTFSGPATGSAHAHAKGEGNHFRDRANLPEGFPRQYQPCPGIFLDD